MSNFVSIITPCYNSGNYISQTIQSVISQTHQNWELLLVDDCSSDETFSVISKFASQDTRIKVFKLEKMLALEWQEITLFNKPQEITFLF